MASDIFYFNSPPGTVTTSRRLYRFRPRPNQRKRRVGKMDSFSPRACMARLDDPIFEPNNLESILSRCFAPFGGPIGQLSPPLPALVHDDEDDSDDGSGGVALPLAEQPAVVDVVDVHDTLPPNVAPHRSTVRNDLYQPGPALGARSDSPLYLRRRRSTGSLRNSLTDSRTTPSILGTSHPRPLTQEIWDEEDSRRLRFALEGSDTSEVPLFESSSADSAEPDFHNPHREVATQLVPAVGADSSEPPVGPGRRRTSQTQASQIDSAYTDGLFANIPQRNGLDDERLLLADEDRLAVDDPRRNYDFADFMNSWLLRSKEKKRIAPVPAKPSLPLPRVKDYLRRDDVDALGCDIQGLRWSCKSPARTGALRARMELHPSNNLTRARKQTPGPLKMPQLAAESIYRFRSFDDRHGASTPHYQLRNLLAATSRSDVFYSEGTRVMGTSLACPWTYTPVMDLSSRRNSADAVRITCLSAFQSTDRSSDVLLAGGFCGEYALLNLASSGPVHEGHVTRAFNGVVTHVHGFRHRLSGSPRAAFCSNDHMLRLMDLDNLRILQAQSFDYAVNCSATSPDGRLRLVVGDGCDALVTDAERGSTLVKLSGHTDHGFACAWAGNGKHAATGAQDGRTLVWDARNFSQPLRDLPSIISCPRSMLFTDNDDLVVAESDDIITIYGAEDYAKRQDIRFFGSIAGVALVNGGSELLVANTDRTVGGLLAFERTISRTSQSTYGEQMLRAGRRGMIRSSLRYPGALPDLLV